MWWLRQVRDSLSTSYIYYNRLILSYQHLFSRVYSHLLPCDGSPPCTIFGVTPVSFAARVSALTVCASSLLLTICFAARAAIRFARAASFLAFALRQCSRITSPQHR